MAAVLILPATTICAALKSENQNRKTERNQLAMARLIQAAWAYNR